MLSITQQSCHSAPRSTLKRTGVVDVGVSHSFSFCLSFPILDGSIVELVSCNLLRKHGAQVATMQQPPLTRASFVFLSLLFVSSLPASLALVLRSPNGTVTHLTSPYFYFGLTTFNVTAPLILLPSSASPFACHPLPPLPLHAIVYVDPLGCSIETKIRHCQEANSVGVISASSADVAGNEVFTQWDGTDKSLLHIPFLHVGREDGDALRAALLQWTLDASNGTYNGSSWTASLSSVDASDNVWAVAYDSVYFLTLFQTLLGLFNLFLILLASRKLYQYLHKTASSSLSARSTSPSSATSVPYLCLSLLLFSSVIVAVYCLVDPFGAKHVLPYVYCRLLLFLCIPLCLASLLLLLLFISDALLSARSAVSSPSASPSSPIALSSSPVLIRAFSFASALSSSTLRPSWLQQKEGKNRLLSPVSSLLFFASLAFLTLFDISMSIIDSLYLSNAINAVTQLTYACIALTVLVALCLVGTRAARRMWLEEQRRKERIQRRQDEVAELQQEREEARKRPIDVDDEALDRVGDVSCAELLALPDTSMRISAAYKHHTPTASPSLLPFVSFPLASSIRALPELPLLRIDSFPSSSTSYQLIQLHHTQHAASSHVPATNTSCDEDVATPPPLLSSPSFSSTTSLLADRDGRCVSVWGVVEGLYGVPRLYRLMRFVALASVGLVGLIVLLCWRPLDSPLTFIGRQGALFVCVGWLSASMISVF